jgi:hypothetical protein
MLLGRVTLCCHVPGKAFQPTGAPPERGRAVVRRTCAGCCWIRALRFSLVCWRHGPGTRFVGCFQGALNGFFQRPLQPQAPLPDKAGADSHQATAWIGDLNNVTQVSPEPSHLGTLARRAHPRDLDIAIRSRRNDRHGLLEVLHFPLRALLRALQRSPRRGTWQPMCPSVAGISLSDAFWLDEGLS